MHSLDFEQKDQHTLLKLSEVNKRIASSKKMIVLTGAGISCNAGIPDFRSTDGLYNMIKTKHPNLVVTGKDLFDISLFRNEATLQVFATFMESLYKHSKAAVPTETHKFIKNLKRQNRLLRCYTQNIDAIERKLELNTGVINDERNQTFFKQKWKNLDVVQLHGDLNYLTCTNCFKNFDWSDEYRELLADGEVPDCPECVESFNLKVAIGKRALPSSIGFLRPSIVLYGENHPNSESLSKGLTLDLKSNPDCLIIFGTSLKVDGVKKLVKTLAKKIHEKENGKVIFINKTKPSSMWNDSIDYFIQCDSDSWVRYLKTELPDLFLTQMELDRLKSMKKNAKAGKKSKSTAMLTPPPTPSKEVKFVDLTDDQQNADNNNNNEANNKKPKPLSLRTTSTNSKVVKKEVKSNSHKDENKENYEFAEAILKSVSKVC